MGSGIITMERHQTATGAWNEMLLHAVQSSTRLLCCPSGPWLGAQ